MDRLLQDLIVSFRRLRSSPGFTVAAILTLALGIGANTTIFSLVNAVVFRPFGVEHQNELVFFNMHLAKAEFPSTSYPDYKDYRDRNTVLSSLALYRIVPMNLSRGSGENSRLWGYEVSGNYFDTLGVKPARGRVLHPEDDVKRGGHPVAVITYNCWQRRFAGDPDIAGKKIKVNGLDFTILGVTPKNFVGTELIFTPEIFVPVAMAAQLEGYDWLDGRGNGNAFVLGRLKPGVSMKSAEASINIITKQLGREYPDNDAGVSIVLSPPGMAGTYLRGAITGFSAVLMVVAGMVLLIACVNLASLLLARAADRRKDTAIRLALGASRYNLIRQLLTESLVLAIAGGTAGLLLAYWLTDLVNAWSPPIDVPVIPHVVMDIRVLLFAAAISLVTGLLFGLVPAMQSTRATLAGAMRNDAPSDKLRRVNLRDLLVTSQVALSVVLLIGSVLVVRSLQHALSLRLGFEPAHAAVVSFDVGLQGYNEERGRAFQRRLLDKVRSMPGIEAAGLIDGLPLTLNISNSGIQVEGKPEARAGDSPMANMYVITPGYLQAMQTRLIAGRDLDARDTKDKPLVVLVNEAFAHQLLPGEDAVGKRFKQGSGKGPWLQIAGVCSRTECTAPRRKTVAHGFRKHGAELAQQHHASRPLASRRSRNHPPIAPRCRRDRPVAHYLRIRQREQPTSACLVPGPARRRSVRIVRFVSRGAGRNRRLRNHGLRRLQKDPRNRHPHGARRSSGTSPASGAEPHRSAGRTRHNHRLSDLPGRRTILRPDPLRR